MAIWGAYHDRVRWERIIATQPDTPVAGTDLGQHDVARARLAALPEVSPLDALAANAELGELLAERRWYVMRDARAAGATWDQIGGQLGITRQGALDYYRRTAARLGEPPADPKPPRPQIATRTRMSDGHPAVVLALLDSWRVEVYDEQLQQKRVVDDSFVAAGDLDD